MNETGKRYDLSSLDAKRQWVWRETIRLHGLAPETRLASSLSPIEVFVCLYYGGILNYDPRQPLWEERDRFIISKGHGSISMYPILADVGFFPGAELERVCQQGSFLGGIPDPIIPGYETVNGSLGHGLGVACGIALALKRKRSSRRVFVMVGDGELYEGAVWEAVMFAGHHALDNLVLIVDENARCMLNYSAKVINIFPLDGKFREFGWHVEAVDGHSIVAIMDCLQLLHAGQSPGKPHVMIAHTIKGHGVPVLENDPMCHVRSLSAGEVQSLLETRL